jgi:hypothetical protein
MGHANDKKVVGVFVCVFVRRFNKSAFLFTIFNFKFSGSLIVIAFGSFPFSAKLSMVSILGLQ